MPKVPQYQESQRLGAMPGGRFGVDGRALSSALGGETWSAVTRAGEHMRATGGQAGGIALDMMRRHNETVAMDRLTTAEAAVLDMQAEQARRKGREALGDAGAGKNGTTPGVSDALRAGLDTLRGQLTADMNPAQTTLFDHVFDRRGRSVLRWGADFEARQREVYETGVEDERLALEARRVLTNGGDREAVSSALGNIRFVEERRGKRLGLTPEAVGANVAARYQATLLPMFDTLLDRGELDRARAALHFFRPALEAGTLDTVRERLRAKTEALAAKAGAQRKRAEAEVERAAQKDAVSAILSDVADFPSLEEQRKAALARADALPDAAAREGARAGIAREMAWREKKRDAADLRAALALSRAAREEGLSPARFEERLDEAGLTERARNLARVWREPEAENTESLIRTMTLLRTLDRGPLEEADALAACLRGGLSERQTRLALAYRMWDGPVTVSRLDEVCLDVGLAPDERGRVQTPPWMYEGVMRDLSRNGLLTGDKPLTDEDLAQSVTRVWRRRETALAARGPDARPAAPVPNFPMLMHSLRQKEPDAGKAAGDAFLQGYRRSVSGLMMGDELDAILAEGDGAAKSGEPSGLAEDITGFLGQLGGDAPALLAGGLLGRALAGTAGTAAGAGVASKGLAQGLGAAAGAGGLTEGVRAGYIDALRQGEVETWDDFQRRARSVLAEAGKGAGLNLALFGAGQGGASAARSLGAGTTLSGAAGAGAEGALLAGGGAAVEGRAPDAGDFGEAALMVLGGRAAGKAYRVGDAETRAVTWALQEMYAKQGLPPRKAAEMLLTDPSGRSVKLLEEGRRHTRTAVERRQRGEAASQTPTNFTDYRSAEHMAMLRGRLRAIRPEEGDFIKTLQPKEAGSQVSAQRMADTVRKNLRGETTPVEVEPGRWALRVDKVPPPPPVDELRSRLRAMYQALKRGETCPPLELGVVGPHEAARIRQCTGQDVLLEKRILRLDAVDHAVGRHGSERTRGQGNLREEDFARYADIVLDPDWIEKGNKPGSILYIRRYADGTVYAVEHNKAGKRLEGRTMWRALPGGQPEILLGLPDGGEEKMAEESGE